MNEITVLERLLLYRDGHKGTFPEMYLYSENTGVAGSVRITSVDKAAKLIYAEHDGKTKAYDENGKSTAYIPERLIWGNAVKLTFPAPPVVYRYDVSFGYYDTKKKAAFLLANCSSLADAEAYIKEHDLHGATIIPIIQEVKL